MAREGTWGQGEWQGEGGGQKAAEYVAWGDFYEMFGRDPTKSELAMLAPAYISGDKNLLNSSTGKGALGQYYQAQENTPEKVYARQQKEYGEKAPEHFGSVDQMFQSTLGRAATDAEKNHFGKLLASGQVDQYGVGQFIQALPESVQRQDKQFREGVSGDLQKQDAQYFNEQIMPGVQSAFANQGRDPRSSAFANSLALAAQGQNRQRESFMSNLTANQYAGSQGLAQRDYMNAYGGYQGLQDYSRQRSAQMQDATTGRINELQNYAIQRQTYDDYLRRYGKQGGVGNMIGGGIQGAGSGAMMGSSFGPWGALIGGVGGGVLGAFGGSGK